MAHRLGINQQSVEFLLETTDLGFTYHNPKDFVNRADGTLEIIFENEEDLNRAKEALALEVKRIKTKMDGGLV